MEEKIRKHLDDIYSEDKDVQGAAYMYLLEETEKPVSWAYGAWDELVEALAHKNNRVRSIAAQLLCNLAKSDPEGRMLNDFGSLLAVTKDHRFVTARHSLQAIWKVGLVGNQQKELVINSLEKRFYESVSEKNGRLVRYDILQDLRNLFDETGNEEFRTKALALIESEEDPKNKKKYAKLWRNT